jgi:D-amino peptidase
MRSSLRLALGAAASAVAGALAPAIAAAQPANAGPRVLLYVDMDGSSGVNRARQVLYPNPEYFDSRKFITNDANAAIRGLFAGGASEVVVTDAHGSGNTEEPDVLVADLDKRATFLFRDEEYDPYIDALDSTYQAIVCVGMHARAGTNGFMAHTVTVEPTYVVNGVPITESALIALSAAKYGIPVIMVAGDDVLREQIKEELPGAEYAVVKRARGRANAELIPQETVGAEIERAARRAIEKLATFTAYKVAPEYRFEVRYQNARQATFAAGVAGVTRIDSLTLGYTTPTFAEGYRKSLEMNGMARVDNLVRSMSQAVGAHPDGRKIMDQTLDLLITGWLEPDKLPKPPARPAAKAKKKYYGDT